MRGRVHPRLAIVARSACVLVLTLAACTGCAAVEAGDATGEIAPLVQTTRVDQDVDDPAIWIHPTDQARSLVIGTVKAAAPAGAVVVYGLDGGIRQVIDGLNRPNNVDVEYGVRLGGQTFDVAVVTERLARQLRLFRIASDGKGLAEIARLPVLEGARGNAGAPMGLGLYRRARDGKVYVIVAPKQGPRENYLWQYALEDEGGGRVRLTFVRRFGRYGGHGEIEAVAVDDGLGYVYYADEERSIHKWHADPDAPGANRELAEFGMDGFAGDREGIGIYARPDGTGYIVAADQRPGQSEFRLYRREGEAGRPHDHSRVVKVVSSPADSTDGIEVTERALGAPFRQGMLVAMNSKAHNFMFFPWERIVGADSLPH
ncbi:MAG: phytase [Vicinamibacterales bacterium]